jgi:hypothetical protein
MQQPVLFLATPSRQCYDMAVRNAIDGWAASPITVLVNFAKLMVTL